MVGVRSFGENAAGIGCRVENDHAFRPRQCDQRLGVAVHQCVAVMGNQDIEIPIAEDRHHHIDLSGGETDGICQALLLHAHQLAERAAHLGEIGPVLGIMEMKYLHAGHAQGFETLLQGTPGARRVEAACLHIAVELG